MPTELVLLSEQAPSPELQDRVAAAFLRDGTCIAYRGGETRQFINAQGLAVLNVFPTRPVHSAEEARLSVKDPPRSFGLWTDMTVPLGKEDDGRALAAAIADAVGGSVKERV